MANFVLLYSGGSMPETEAEQAAVMQAWGAWFGQLGSALVNGGNPFTPQANTSRATERSVTARWGRWPPGTLLSRLTRWLRLSRRPRAAQFWAAARLQCTRLSRRCRQRLAGGASSKTAPGNWGCYFFLIDVSAALFSKYDRRCQEASGILKMYRGSGRP